MAWVTAITLTPPPRGKCRGLPEMKVLCRVLYMSGLLLLAPLAAGQTGQLLSNQMPVAITDFASTVVQELLSTEQLQGAAVALIYPGAQPFGAAFGFASLEPQLPFTPHTLTAQHELAQLFTALAILQLADAGKLQLDANFTQYFPDFQPFAHNARHTRFTIGQLLSHHSGLPAYYAAASGFENFAYTDGAGDFRNILDNSSQLAMVAEPGEVYEYSYLGYTLLGLLIESVSGESYSQYIATHILEPLGMTNTHFVSDPLQIAGVATAYRDDKPVEHERFRDIPAAGLISTVDDMGRFIQALMTPGSGLLSEASRQAMFSARDASPYDANLAIGLGYFITPVTGGIFRDMPTASHASTDGATRTYLIAVPSEQLAVVLTTNTRLSSVKLRDTADRILENMLGFTSAPATTAFAPHPEVPLTPARSQAISGHFSGPGGTYYIESGRKGLSLDVPYLPFLRVSLIPRAQDFYGVQLRFLGLGLGMISQLELLAQSVEGKVMQLNGQRLVYWYWRGVAAVTLTENIPAADDADFAAWQARTGDYLSEVTGARYRLAFDRDSGNFTFGNHAPGLHLIREPPDLYCLEGARVMHTCGKGLVGNGSRNALRILEDGSLLSAYGVRYTLK